MMVTTVEAVKPLQLVLLQHTPIYEQLALEEALLRAGEKNYCIINENAPPAIVMGISGKADEHIDYDNHKTHPVPIIRRFSGGGTVVVDENTLFVSFIFSRKDIDLGCCPKKIGAWTEALYKPVFEPHNFHLRENDYVIGEKKIGGNAQYFSQTRWLHHTTFLWDYKLEYMDLLKMPPKMPEYRQKRRHSDFLDALTKYFPSKKELKDKIIEELSCRFVLEKASAEELDAAQKKPHRKATAYLTILQ